MAGAKNLPTKPPALPFMRPFFTVNRNPSVQRTGYFLRASGFESRATMPMPVRITRIVMSVKAWDRFSAEVTMDHYAGCSAHPQIETGADLDVRALIRVESSQRCAHFGNPSISSYDLLGPAIALAPSNTTCKIRGNSQLFSVCPMGMTLAEHEPLGGTFLQDLI
jgi:hypothetical protein